ncbi:MAG: chloride channel protein [Thermodesulfobacteriota bacterium]
MEARSDDGASSRNGASLARRGLVQLLVPCAIGVATGACVAGASHVVEDLALETLASLPGALPAVPSIFGLLLTLLVVRHVTRVAHPATAEVYILAYHDPHARIPLRELPGRVLAAAVTVASGGSQGLESPSALIGASLGQISGGRLGRMVTTDDARSWMVAGASAGIAAVFSSPGVGAMYGIEVPFRRDVDAPRLVPAAVAAGAAYWTRAALVGPSTLVTLRGEPPLDALLVLGCLLTAVGCGLGARLFAIATEELHRLASRTSALARAAAGGALLAALAWGAHALAGAWLTFGPGYVAARWLEGGEHAVWLLAVTALVRTAGTLTCVWGGGGGGVFTSLAVTGVFVGELVAQALGRSESSFLPLLGSAVFLGAGYRIPLAGMLLVAESSGSLVLTVVGIVAVGIGQVLMGEHSVSDAKRERRSPDELFATAAERARAAATPRSSAAGAGGGSR